MPASEAFAVAGIVAALFAATLVILRARQGKYDLNSKHVVITGGSSGIGKAIARQALQRGATVTLMARKKTMLESTKKELSEHGSVHVKSIGTY